MRIKNAEGQTLLTLLRLCIVFIACLSVCGAQALADKTFYLINNAETLAMSFLKGMDDVPEEERPTARTTSLYYVEDEGRGTQRIFERYYLLGEEGHLVLTDMSGERVISGEYQDVIVLPHSYVLKQNNVWTFVTRENLEALSEQTWDDVHPDVSEDGLLASNLVLVEKDGLYGAVDLTGQPAISPVYEEFNIYSYSAPWPLIRVKKDGLWGFIDLDGDTVISPKYDYALLDTITVFADENDAEGTEVPVIYVLQGDEWGGIFRNNDGSAKAVDWDVEPSEEAMADYKQSV